MLNQWLDSEPATAYEHLLVVGKEEDSGSEVST